MPDIFKPVKFLVADNVAWCIDERDGSEELAVAPFDGNAVDWEALIWAKDVEDWYGTHWENMSPSFAAIDAYRDRIKRALDF